MQLHAPFEITSRLLPGIRLADAMIQIEYSNRDGDNGRTRYKWTVDVGDIEFTGEDLQSGCGGGSLQEGMESLISFLAAAGSSYSYCVMDGDEITDDDNASLFPLELTKWASENHDELSMLECELRETSNLIME